MTSSSGHLSLQTKRKRLPAYSCIHYMDLISLRSIVIVVNQTFLKVM